MTAWTEVGDRVFVRRHASYDMNVGLVVGTQRCLVIDTRASLGEGIELAGAVREVSAAPCVLVNTHAHFDHFLGNAAFPAAQIWASARCAQVVAATGHEQRSGVAQTLRDRGAIAEADDVAATPIEGPTHTFSTGVQALDLGGRQAELRYLGRGHTDTDIVITVAGVTFAGDLVEQGAPPAYEDSYPLDWPDTITSLLDHGEDGPVVPGHGAVVDREFVLAQQAELLQVVAACRELAEADIADDAWRLTGLPEHYGRVALARGLAQLRGELD